VIHPVPLLRSWTPVEPMCPCLSGHIDAAPTLETVKASDDDHFGAHSRSFDTCSPTLRVSRCHSRARLASGWLAGLYREGVEPSGSLRRFQIMRSSSSPVLPTLLKLIWYADQLGTLDVSHSTTSGRRAQSGVISIATGTGRPKAKVRSAVGIKRFSMRRRGDQRSARRRNIAVLRENAEGPDGSIARQGWDVWTSPGTARRKISASSARREIEIVTRLGALAKLRESHDYEFMTMCRAKPEMLARFAGRADPGIGC
jgi:hypothetical protein